MKQMRGLLVAAIALAVLSGLIYWSKKHKAEEAAKPPADAGPKVLSLDEKRVNEVRVEKAGAEPVVLSKLGDRWEITQPQPMPADQETVKSMISTAGALTAERVIEDQATDLKPFGLAPPTAQVKFGGAKPATVLLGSDTPAGGATYAKIAGDPRVFTLGAAAKSSLDKSLNDLRDKRLLTFDPEKLSRVELTAKGPAMEFGKNAQNDWQILKPSPLRADALQVDDLVRKLKSATIQVDAGKIAVSTFAAAPKVATVAFTDNGGTQTVEIRQDKNKNTYAKSSVLDAVYQVAADVADAANKSLPDFRSKKLFDFGFGELGEITAQGVTFKRSGEKWFANGKEMDGSSVQNLIDKLRDLTATGFSNKSSGGEVFTASVVTQDKKRSEKIKVLRDGSTIVAVREGEPAIYTLDASAGDDLLKAAAAVKPAVVSGAKPPGKK